MYINYSIYTGKVETTSNTYKYKMQVQGSDSMPSTPSQQSLGTEEQHTQLQVDQMSLPHETNTIELDSSSEQSPSVPQEVTSAQEESQAEASTTESGQS